MININLIGFKNSFNSAIGDGGSRYSYELYNNLINYRGINVKSAKIEPIFNKERALAYFISSYKFVLLNNLEKADIWHFVADNPAISGRTNRLTKNAKRTIATAMEFGNLNKFGSSELGWEDYALNNLNIKDRLMWEIIQINLKGNLNADHLIVVSSQTRDEAIKLGYNPKDISLVNLGVDGRFMKPFKHENRKIFTVGYIGSFKKRKNVEFAIKALNYINNKIRFNIYGKGSYYNYLNISKNKNTNFKGFASNKYIIDIYDSFDAFVFPSLYEGFGLPIFEAQARGLPVVIYKYRKYRKR